MLIDFTVENYRSIRDPVTLSAIEATRGPGKTRQGTGKRRGIKADAEISTPHQVPGRNFGLLPVLGIFGANASGKTNLLRALDDLLWLMTHEASASEHVFPFELDAHSVASPTNFRLRVAVDGSIYTYSLRVDRRQVYREALEWLPGEAGDARPIFSRESDQHMASSKLQLSKDIAGIFATPPSDISVCHTMMGMLAQYEAHPVLSPLAAWLKQSLRGISLGYSDIEREIASYWAGKQELARTAILQFLRGFDVSIVDLVVRRELRCDGFVDDVLVYHDTPEGRVAWSLDYESLGTRRLFEMAPKLLWTLRHGKLALFDELGTNLHPYITERIVRLFQSEATNPRRAQLIFTSHDNTLLQNQLLRRDQVLFTERRSDGSTDLYSVSDFRARNDLALDKAYLDGRFGAVPVLPAKEEMITAARRAE